MNCVRIGVIAAAVVVLAPVLAAQDNSLNPGPQSMGPQSMGSQSAGQAGGASSSTNGTQASSAAMRDSLGAPGETGQQMMDQQFVRNAVAGGIADVRLGTLATEKGGPSVKELAQKMVDDHTTLNKDMASVADSLGILVPKKMPKDDQAEYEKLNGLSGKDFDTEYLTYIVKAHWQNLHAYYMEASLASDPALQTEVVKAMFTMHQHLGMITKTAADEGITLPARPPRPAQTTAAK
jgi:putative membrane protein